MKIWILLTFLFIFPVALFAQENKIKFGLKAGINFSEFKYSQLPNILGKTQPDNGFYAGGQFVFNLKNNLYLQPEIFYIESRIQDYNTIGNLVAKEELKHLSVPLLARLRLGHFGLYAGPQLSFRLSADLKLNQGDVETDVTESSYTKTNFSGVVGAEYTFQHRFGLDIRYQQGFSNIRSTNGITPLTDQDGQNIKLSGLQIGLYYRFGRYRKK